MCGIVAVLRRRSEAGACRAEDVSAHVSAALEALPSAADVSAWLPALTVAKRELTSADALLRTPSGLRLLFESAALAGTLTEPLEQIAAAVHELEQALDRGAEEVADLESLNAALVRVKDAEWAIRIDRLGAVREIRDLAPETISPAGIEALAGVQVALSALARLEVRGRDSAGVHLMITGHGLDFESPEVKTLLGERHESPLFGDGAVRLAGETLNIVYKTAAEIGELGDNDRALRQSLRSDSLLQAALASDQVEIAVLAHTRWASVGMISEANTHPLDEAEEPAVAGRPYVVAALNGDVDNYADLKADEGLAIREEISTDAKVIPVMMSRRAHEGAAHDEAFRDTVSQFVGSVAIAAAGADDPDRLHLALRGSGQALYVGFDEGSYIVASEPYGLVEQTSSYLRLDGETPGNPENPSASRGQVVVLDRARAGDPEAVERFAYDGTPLPVSEDDVDRAGITTRDVDRGDYPHFLLKEISEAPSSFRKTLRGKIREGRVVLGDETLPEELREAWAEGRLRRVLVIGQGTAAVAGQGVAGALREVLAPLRTSGRLNLSEVRALPATELSGFGLEADMSDCLIVAISQSGTTTDTNRTVDLVRGRGAKVVAIVNRRHSDLTDKADGVLYTSDGRDVEMSVASTKAFYSQIAAGFLLACALAEVAAPGQSQDETQREVLDGLQAMPELMEETLATAPAIEEAAFRHAPRHRYWALVGNGSNLTAAEEIRIKLSELCYKSIACDATEDKKHIDLSSEPLILVCAAGLVGSTADDVAKEVAIYKAHKATPIVIASQGDQRFSSAVELLAVPRCHRSLAFVLSAVVGHLFGYHAARAIDRQARPLRQIRSEIERLVSDVGASQEPPGAGAPDLVQRLRQASSGSVKEYFTELVDGAYNGHLEAATAVDLASLLHVVEGTIPLESYQAQRGRSATPGAVLADLNDALTRAIDELTRPIDAIKHQAKTVTVGISRTDEAFLLVPLITELLSCGADRDRISYADLRALAALDPVVERVTGFTRYRLDGDPASERCEIHVQGSGGIARDFRSRTHASPTLKGTKHEVAVDRRLLAARGRSDGRTFLIVPEIDRGRTQGLTLLHVKLRDRAKPQVLRGVLSEYRNRYSRLRDAVLETEPSFREDILAELAVADLLFEPIHLLAENFRHASS